MLFISTSVSLNSHIHNTVQLISGDAVVFVRAKYGAMPCYKLVLTTMANLAITGIAICILVLDLLYWNAVNSDVMSFPAQTSDFRDKWDAAKDTWLPPGA